MSSATITSGLRATFLPVQAETQPLLPALPDTLAGLQERVRRQLSTASVEGVIQLVSKLGYAHPGADPRIYGLDIRRDVAYLDGGAPEHTLDVYLPTDRPGPWPVVMYVHGGSFRMMRKETHWMMAMAFARRGYLVFNVNYRLAPAHPFPAALEDVSAAWLWVLKNAKRFGGDTSRVVVAGESAGANLVTALTLQTTYRREEPWARPVFEAGRVPDAVMAACGIFQVSDVERFFAKNPLSWLVGDRLLDCRDGYLGTASRALSTELADPLLVLEQGDTPERPLPPFFMPVGSADPLVDDTHRMAQALRSLNVTHEAVVYPGQVHGFHMMTWFKAAKKAWGDWFAFLEAAVPAMAKRPAAPVASRWNPADRIRSRIVATMLA